MSCHANPVRALITVRSVAEASSAIGAMPGTVVLMHATCSMLHPPPHALQSLVRLAACMREARPSAVAPIIQHPALLQLIISGTGTVPAA